MKIEMINKNNYENSDEFAEDFWDFIYEVYPEIRSENHKGYIDAYEEFMECYFDIEDFIDESNINIIDNFALEQVKYKNDKGFHEFVKNRINGKNFINIEKLAYKYLSMKAVIDQMPDDFKRFLFESCNVDIFTKKSMKIWFNRYQDIKWIKWIIRKTDEQLEEIRSSEYAKLLFCYGLENSDNSKFPARERIQGFIYNNYLNNEMNNSN